MFQWFSKPDCYIAACGDLRCVVKVDRLEKAPSFLRGLRVAFCSDFHVLHRTTEEAINGLCRKIADLHADLILFGGDLADQSEPARRLICGLGSLSAPLGLYAAPGNNDRETFPDIGALKNLMGRYGIVLLVNEAKAIHYKGGRLIVAGLDEYRYGHPDPAGLYPSRGDGGCFSVLISHYPIAVNPMPDLMLSGHTHGGQFNLLGLTPYAIGFERLLTPRRASRFIAGIHDYRGSTVLVSKGIGASRIPLRIGVQPEINLIEFV